MAERVDVRSLHIVKAWIDERIKSARFRKCGHLTVLPLNEYHEGVNVPATHIYFPHCERDSFEWSQARLGRDSEIHILRHMLHSEPIACPANCRSFEHRYWTSAKRLLMRFLHLLEQGASAFLQLPWQTQVLIVFLVILLFAPHWIPPMIDLFRALQ